MWTETNLRNNKQKQKASSTFKQENDLKKRALKDNSLQYMPIMFKKKKKKVQTHIMWDKLLIPTTTWSTVVTAGWKEIHSTGPFKTGSTAAHSSKDFK